MDHQINKISKLLAAEDWFAGATRDKHNKVVVYTKYQNYDVLTSIPDYVDNDQILIHFAPQDAEKFSTSIVLSKEGDLNEKDLNNTLLKLELSSGKEIVYEIFYEILDGANAVSNFSEMYPSIRKTMEELLEIYGFDVLEERVRLPVE